MTALVLIEYGSGQAVEDARLEAALRRVRGRLDKGKAHLSVHLALGVLAAACLGLRVEGSISMEVGRQKKLGLVPVARVMIAKRGETCFVSGSLERELSNHVGSKPQRAYELFRSWLPRSAELPEEVIRLAINSIGTPDVLDGKVDEARPHLPTWCEHLAAFLQSDLGLKLRLEASDAMRSRMPKRTETVDVAWLTATDQSP
jgi:hypothetical protein